MHFSKFVGPFQEKYNLQSFWITLYYSINTALAKSQFKIWPIFDEGADSDNILKHFWRGHTETFFSLKMMSVLKENMIWSNHVFNKGP